MNRFSRTSVRLCLALVPTLGMAVACGVDGGSAPATTTAAADMPEYTIRWTTPEEELLTADGTFVRAFWESFFRASLAPGGAIAAYPGYDEVNRGAVSRPPKTAVSDQEYRTIFLGLGGVTTLPDGTARATLCSSSDRGGRAGGYSFLDFVRDGAQPPAGQSGSAQVPNTNVFGGWYAVRVSNASADPAAQQACAGTRPTNPVERGQDPLPAYPGWPAS